MKDLNAFYQFASFDPSSSWNVTTHPWGNSTLTSPPPPASAAFPPPLHNPAPSPTPWPTGPPPPSTPLDLEAYLTSQLGSRHRPTGEAAVLTAVYAAVFLTGVVGNVCTGVVVASRAYMRTATNYYLCSLAISDLLTLLLGLPPELYTVWEAYPWVFGAPYCLFKTFLTETTSSASILTIAAFTVERYLAICRPLLAQALCTPRRALKVIGAIWVAAGATAAPYPAFTRTFYHLDHPLTGRPIAESLVCNIPSDWMEPMRVVFQLSSFLLFVLPMGLISVLYVLIGLTVRRSSAGANQRRAEGLSKQAQPRKAVLKMLVTVVVAFFLCWAPFHAQRLMTVYTSETQWTDALLELQSVLFYVSGVLYFVSCTVNPILYSLMSRRYREAFRETLCPCCPPLPSLVARGRVLILARGTQNYGVNPSRRRGGGKRGLRLEGGQEGAGGQWEESQMTVSPGGGPVGGDGWFEQVTSCEWGGEGEYKE